MKTANLLGLVLLAMLALGAIGAYEVLYALTIPVPMKVTRSPDHWETWKTPHDPWTIKLEFVGPYKKEYKPELKAGKDINVSTIRLEGIFKPGWYYNPTRYKYPHKDGEKLRVQFMGSDVAAAALAKAVHFYPTHDNNKIEVTLTVTANLIDSRGGYPCIGTFTVKLIFPNHPSPPPP